MDDYMADFLKIAGKLILAVVAVVLGLAVAGSYAIDQPSCYAHWRDSGYQVRWSLFGDCQISADGKSWITDDAYVALNKHIKVQK